MEGPTIDEVCGLGRPAHRGVLAHEPFEAPLLRAGQDVVVNEDDAFDYLLRQPDGSHEGNETSRIIEAERERRKATDEGVR